MQRGLGTRSDQWDATARKPLDAAASAQRWRERARNGYSAPEKRWLHLDDNIGIFLQYNDGDVLFDSWRTGILPKAIRARETPHFLGFEKSSASREFYSKFEAQCDGIIDMKSE